MNNPFKRKEEVSEGDIVEASHTEASVSPVPQLVDDLHLTTYYAFPEAIEHIINGKQVTRIEWADKETYGVLRNGVLTIHRDGKDFQWIVSDGDLVATDWIVI